jgi:hypothetical protein
MTGETMPRLNTTHPNHWTPLPEPYTAELRPLWYHRRGLSQTVSGYGKALTSPHVIRLADGRTRRVYVTIYSNIGTAWVILDGVARLVSYQ